MQSMACTNQFVYAARNVQMSTVGTSSSIKHAENVYGGREREREGGREGGREGVNLGREGGGGEKRDGGEREGLKGGKVTMDIFHT